jgi:hypothetical protein
LFNQIKQCKSTVGIFDIPCWQVLSDYIVKNRGIMPGSARDAYDQYREVESIVMSTYKACTETDVEGDGRPFTAEVRADLLPFVSGLMGSFVPVHMCCRERLNSNVVTKVLA